MKNPVVNLKRMHQLYIHNTYNVIFLCLIISGSTQSCCYRRCWPDWLLAFVYDWRRGLLRIRPGLFLHIQMQGSHRLEKYLNLEGFLEKSLKIKSTLKITGKSRKSLEKALNSTIFSRTKHC